jgi:hypothetical protein
MKLSSPFLFKADELLLDALQEAKPNEPMRALLFLDGQDAEAPSNAEILDPDQFESRTDYRRELLARRSAELSNRLGQTLDALRELSLQVHGGSIQHAVLVEGPAAKILESLALEGVRKARLDRPVELIRPRRSF